MMMTVHTLSVNRWCVPADFSCSEVSVTGALSRAPPLLSCSLYLSVFSKVLSLVLFFRYHDVYLLKRIPSLLHLPMQEHHGIVSTSSRHLDTVPLSTHDSVLSAAHANTET